MILSLVVCILIGIACIVIGIMNMMGNISTLHSYHRSRVKEEDILPFGRLVGIGTMLTGVGTIFMGILNFMAEKLENSAYMIGGTVTFSVFLVIGLGIAFFGMIKYNKGIF